MRVRRDGTAFDSPDGTHFAREPQPRRVHSDRTCRELRMLVTLDDATITIDSLAPDARLRDLVDAVRASHAPGRLVVSLALNGRVLAPEELNAALQQPLTGGDEIRLETGEPQALACNTFHELAVAFAEARWQHSGVADQFAAGSHDAAIRELGAYFELWQTCQQALAQCGELLAQDLTGFSYHALPLGQYLSSAAGVLGQIRTALEARDYVSLGDLVRYELPMLSETWAGIFEELKLGFDAEPA